MPLDPRLFSFNSPQGACAACGGLGQIEAPEDGLRSTCPRCLGSRLKPLALSVTIGGFTIWELMQTTAGQLKGMINGFSFSDAEKPVAEPVMSEILSRLELLNRLGLSYLSLGRSGDTLSGGEAQRVRLSAQLGSNLTGILYILDEPTIGLHPRDSGILIHALKTLRDRGNTVLVVEHDEETIRQADTLIDLGPGAGRDGGWIVASGTPEFIKNTENSVTGNYLKQKTRTLTSRLRRFRDQPQVEIQGACLNNLKSIDVAFPLGTLIAVTGVSGSGKSTLVKGTLFPAVRCGLEGRPVPEKLCRSIQGWEAVKRILEVDHSPIGKTPRSVPASYVGFYADIRQLFAMTPASRTRGYAPGRFSFNVEEGRCAACKGQGHNKIEMSFLPDVYVPCDVCQGKRFNLETLMVVYKGKTISDVLDMTFLEALAFFTPVPAIRRALVPGMRHRPGVSASGPAQPHAFRRGGPAHQTGPSTGQSLRRSHGLCSGRAIHGASPLGCGAAGSGASVPGGSRKHGGCHRAQSGYHSGIRSCHRSWPGRRICRRAGGGNGFPGGNAGHVPIPYGKVSEAASGITDSANPQ